MRPEDEGLAGAMKVVLAGALGLGLGLAAGGLVLWKDGAAEPPQAVIALVAGAPKTDGGMSTNYLRFASFEVRLAANRLGGVGAGYPIDGGLVEASRAIVWHMTLLSNQVEFVGHDFRSVRSGLDYLFAGWTIEGNPTPAKTQKIRVPDKFTRNLTAHWITAKKIEEKRNRETRE